MEISVEIDESELEIIDSSIKGNKLGLAKAAIKEYMDMISGDKVFSRASDIREYRLLLLIENVFDGMPDEKDVANLFQLKSSEARTLMKNVDAKYRKRIAKTKKNSLLKVINSIECDKKSSYYEFDCDSVYKIESLNDLILSDCEIIQKVSNKKNRYTINANTLTHLKERLK